MHKSRSAKAGFFKFYIKDCYKTLWWGWSFVKDLTKIGELFMRWCLVFLRVSREWVAIHRMAQESPDARINVINLESQVTFAPSCTYLSIKKWPAETLCKWMKYKTCFRVFCVQYIFVLNILYFQYIFPLNILYFQYIFLLNILYFQYIFLLNIFYVQYAFLKFSILRIITKWYQRNYSNFLSCLCDLRFYIFY